MLSGRQPAVNSAQVVTTVFSVGPYSLSRVRPWAHFTMTSSGVLSPPTTSTRRQGSLRQGSKASRAGGIRAWLTFSLSSRPRRRSASLRSVSVGMTSVEPDSRAGNISSTEASNPMLAYCSTRLSACRLKIPDWLSANSASEAWLTGVPFGCPVVPEV